MTYSIVAYDPASGAAGVCTATGGLAVGAFVPHVRAGVGAIATQGASTNWLYGDRGLELLGGGCSAEQTLKVLTGDDSGRDYRQCAIVDAASAAVAWTGDTCEAVREQQTGSGVAVVGNRLVGEGVAAAMLDAFAAAAGIPLAERLLAALEAGDTAGGDLQGAVSSALRVDAFDHPPVDIRVDYAPGEAVARLRDLLRRYRSAPFRTFYDTVPTRRDFSKCKA